ncbi:TonB-dependent receptor [Massilia sp. H-1]|nr:TonB-dependent receptor [Massilia sp. H-1]
MNKDIVARFGVSRTMSRPDFGALGGTVSLTDETHTGNGGNAKLQPVISNNIDATVQWYYAPRALVSAGLFYMDLHDYVGYGVSTGTFIDSRASEQSGSPVFAQYSITSPVNVRASIKGAEFAAQVPLGAGFGLDGNLTLADSKQAFGSCPAMQTATSSSPCDMLGASKVTANVKRLLRDRQVECTYRLRMALVLPGSPGPRHAAVPGCCGPVVDVLQLLVQQKPDPEHQRPEHEQSDPEELRVQQGSARPLLLERRAVLRRSASEILRRTRTVSSPTRHGRFCPGGFFYDRIGP